MPKPGTARPVPARGVDPNGWRCPSARAPDGRYPAAVTSPERPTPVRPVDYKGEPLDAERGPGLGCFWVQLTLLVILLVLTPLTVAWGWNPIISMVLLFAVLILLLFAGQTVIFLLRLVAADRREGVRHAPRAASSPTVGQMEDAVHVDALGRPIEAPGEAPGEAPVPPEDTPAAPEGVPPAPDERPATDGSADGGRPGITGVRE
jgi:hypothetical protein